MVHPAGDQLPGHEKEEQGGQQGQADEGEDQPGAQPGAEDLAAPLQEELGEMPEDEEGEEQQQEGVDIKSPKARRLPVTGWPPWCTRCTSREVMATTSTRVMAMRARSRRRFRCSLRCSCVSRAVCLHQPFSGSLTVKVLPPPGGGVHRDGAVVVGDDLVDHRQPQAGAFILGGEKGVEDLFHDLRGHAFAGVLDGKPHLVVLGAAGTGQCGRRLPLASRAFLMRLTSTCFSWLGSACIRGSRGSSRSSRTEPFSSGGLGHQGLNFLDH